MTTKNQCCESCIPPKVKLGGVIDYPMGCQNTSCKCHQRDSVVELVKELRMVSNMIHMGERIQWGRETTLMDKAADMLTALQQTAQQEKEDLIVEVLSKAEIQGMNGAWVYQGDIKAIAQAKGISVSDK